MRMRETVNVGELTMTLLINMNVDQGQSKAKIQGQNMA